jgi:hypothetical protein
MLFAKPRPKARKTSPPAGDKPHRRPAPAVQDDDSASDTESQSSNLPDPFSDEDPGAEYRKFKARTTLKRKAAAAETNRIRAQKKSRTAAATAVIGRKNPVGKKGGGGSRDIASYGAGSDAETTEGKEKEKEKGTYLDEPTPEYIETRKKKLKRLHEAGLRYPPCYDDIEFSDNEDEEEEKPVLHPDIKTQREKRDIKLRDTAGMACSFFMTGLCAKLGLFWAMIWDWERRFRLLHS